MTGVLLVDIILIGVIVWFAVGLVFFTKNIW
jgi:hypothetical protein